MYHVKNQVQTANRPHLRALSGVMAQVEGLGECPAQLSSHCLLSATTLGRGHCPAALIMKTGRAAAKVGTGLAIPSGFPWRRFTPGLPGESGHSSLRRSSSITKRLLPLPCFMAASHCVTAAPLCPCARTICGDPNRGQPTCPGSCTRL